MHKNLILVYQFCNTNKTSVEFFPDMFQVKDLGTGAPLLQRPVKDCAYEWPNASAPHAFSSSKSSWSDWHHRLGHPAFPILKSILSSFPNIGRCNGFESSSCNSCLINKSHKLPFSHSSIISTHPLQILFSDVWTSPIVSVDGYKYYLTIVDHFTRYIWFYPLKLKSQVAATFIKFKALVENQFRHRIRTFYTDNGGEFLVLRTFLADNGITHLTTPPHTPEHNGLAERRHRHIVETGLALLTHSSMPVSYWTYAFATAVFLINRMPIKVISMESPFHKLFLTPPNYTRLKVFGSLCFPWLRPYTTNKLSPRSAPCVFLGYSLTQSAYLCLDLTTSRLFVSRHVQFYESSFPFAKQFSSLVSSQSPNNEPEQALGPIVTPFQSCIRSLVGPLQPASQPLTPDPPPEQEMPSEIHTQHAQPEPALPQMTQNQHAMHTRSKNNIHKPNAKYGYLAVVTSDREPATVTQALADRRWSRAMSEEFDAKIRHHTWDLVHPSLAPNLIGYKWVFKLKFLPDGSIDRFKARLVTKDFINNPVLTFMKHSARLSNHPLFELCSASLCLKIGRFTN